MCVGDGDGDGDDDDRTDLLNMYPGEPSHLDANRSPLNCEVRSPSFRLSSLSVPSAASS